MLEALSQKLKVEIQPGAVSLSGLELQLLDEQRLAMVRDQNQSVLPKPVIAQIQTNQGPILMAISGYEQLLVAEERG